MKLMESSIYRYSPIFDIKILYRLEATVGCVAADYKSVTQETSEVQFSPNLFLIRWQNWLVYCTRLLI